MPWLTYWRGNTRVREMTIEAGSETEITGMLEQLAIRQMDLDASDSSQHAANLDQDVLKVRTNRSGTMLWTTGRAFHYTAEWYLRSPRKQKPS